MHCVSLKRANKNTSFLTIPEPEQIIPVFPEMTAVTKLVEINLTNVYRQTNENHVHCSGCVKMEGEILDRNIKSAITNYTICWVVKDPALDVSKVYALGEEKKQLELHHLLTVKEGWWWRNIALELLQNRPTNQKPTKDAGDATIVT